MKHSRGRVCHDADGRINAGHFVHCEPYNSELVATLNIIDTVSIVILYYACL